MTKSPLLPYLEATFAAIVWGASFIATKVALKDISPIAIVWLRFGMGLLVLGAAVAARKQFALPKKNEWGYFALLGFLGITFHQWLQSNGLQTSEAGTTAWIVASTPVFMAILGWLILKEGLSLLKIFGILLAFVGVLLVVSDGNPASIRIGKFGAPGDALILVSAINWAVVSVLSRRGLKTNEPALFVFYMMTFGWLFTSALAIAGGNFVEIPRLTFDGWLGITFLGVFCSGLAYIAWYDALQALTTASAGAFLYIEPLIAMIVAFFILNEAITVAALVGGGIILLGVWLVNKT
ncbi:MAG: DMT family transporter [Anaerolineales bacterium]|nr:MAG: DMT family transporter [Anaerolineales bacterium]